MLVGQELWGKKVSCPYCENVTFAPYPRDTKRTKRCPFCQEIILKEATKCRYCSEFIPKEPGRVWFLLRSIKKTLGIDSTPNDTLRKIPVGLIDSNPYQPREVVFNSSLEGLKRSIRQYGVIVPIIVSKRGDRYQLVAGQRRLMAVKELGFKYIPAILRRLSIKEMMEVGYLENLHREDLDKIDRLQIFERILNEYPDIGRERLAQMMGLNIEEINKGREILKLPVLIQEAIRARMISEESGFILKDIPGKKRLLHAVEYVYRNRLDLKQTEEYVNSILKRSLRYVSGRDSLHFHHPSCAYATLIPEQEKQRYYSKIEALKEGKRACMVCL
jgi:ParB family chromosome partitioning protein